MGERGGARPVLPPRSGEGGNRRWAGLSFLPPAGRDGVHHYRPGCTAWPFKLPSRAWASVILTSSHPGASALRAVRAMLEDSPWLILLATEFAPSVQPQVPALPNHAVLHPCAFLSLDRLTFSKLKVPPLPQKDRRTGERNGEREEEKGGTGGRETWKRRIWVQTPTPALPPPLQGGLFGFFIEG